MQKPKGRGKRKSSGEEKGKVGKGISIEDEWEGLMGNESDTGGNRRVLPPFEAIKAMFVDDLDWKRRKTARQDDGEKDDTASEDAGSGSELDGRDEEEEVSRASKHAKGNLKSGYYAKAGSTRIVRQVLHAHATIDVEEVSGQERALSELPFHLLVAGEIEIVFG